MVKRLIVPVSILFIVFIVILFGIEAGIISPVKVNPIELYSDYKTAKSLAEEIFTEELKDTGYTFSVCTPFIRIESDCPSTAGGWVVHPHGHERCPKYFDVQNTVKTTLRKNGETIDAYCFVSNPPKNEENKVFTTAYYDKIYAELADFLDENIAEIYPDAKIDIYSFYGHHSCDLSTDIWLFPYEITSLEELFADPTAYFYLRIRLWLPTDTQINEELCQKLLELIPNYQSRQFFYELFAGSNRVTVYYNEETSEMEIHK